MQMLLIFLQQLFKKFNITDDVIMYLSNYGMGYLSTSLTIVILKMIVPLVILNC